jgi:hypothetical protein
MMSQARSIDYSRRTEIRNADTFCPGFDKEPIMSVNIHQRWKKKRNNIHRHS